MQVNAKKEALAIARKSINDAFSEKYELPKVKNKELMEKAGVFTTLWKNKELRGCIGALEENEIAFNIYRSARWAAFNDPRFYPLQKEELKEVEIEISILTPFQEVKKPYEKNIEIGKDGLMVEHPYGRGLLLPQVATEYDMNIDEFLDSLAKKAGLRREELNNGRIYKFQAEVFKESEIGN